MKVVLEAFGGKLRSEPMDWPENSAPRIHLMLDMEKMVVSPRGFDRDGMVPDGSVCKRGEFEWTGHWYPLRKGVSAKRYVLIGIS